MYTAGNHADILLNFLLLFLENVKRTQNRMFLYYREVLIAKEQTTYFAKPGGNFDTHKNKRRGAINVIIIILTLVLPHFRIWWNI